jgi:hypothetical protein
LCDAGRPLADDQGHLALEREEFAPGRAPDRDAAVSDGAAPIASLNSRARSSAVALAAYR